MRTGTIRASSATARRTTHRQPQSASCAEKSRCAIGMTVRPSNTAASERSRCPAARRSISEVASSSTSLWGRPRPAGRASDAGLHRRQRVAARTHDRVQAPYWPAAGASCTTSLARSATSPKRLWSSHISSTVPISLRSPHWKSGKVNAADRYSPPIAVAFEVGLTTREATRRSDVMRASLWSSKPIASVTVPTRGDGVRVVHQCSEPVHQTRCTTGGYTLRRKALASDAGSMNSERSVA
jgi:hypothetical protein